MTSPYKLFKTNKNLEQTGVKLDYGDFYIVIARAGGSNEKYKKEVERKLKPYQNQLRSETLSNDLAEKLFREIYASSVILNWGSKSHGEGNLEDENGNALPYSYENCIKLLEDVPDLFKDIQEQSQKIAIFKQEELKKDVENLSQSSNTPTETEIENKF